MPKRVPLPTGFDRAPFAVAHARAAGLGEKRLRGSDLSRPFHGVRVSTSAEVDHRARLLAPRMPPTHFFSHLTAARLLGLPLPARLAARDELHVGVRSPGRAPRIAGVSGHQFSAQLAPLVEVDGLRLTDPVDTWCSLSTMLTVRELVIVGDALVRRKNPISSMAELEQAVRNHHGRRGSTHLHRAFALVRARTDSVRETVLRLLIIDAGLPEPVVNVPILDAHGVFVGFGDLAYPEFRVLVEYDGGQHREDEKQFNDDIDRLDRIMELRWRVIRVNKSHLGSRRDVILARIRTALVDAGWKPPPVGRNRPRIPRSHLPVDGL